MSRLAELMQQYVIKQKLTELEGVKETAIEGVFFYRSEKGNPFQPIVYQSGIIILGQGSKNIHIGEKPVHYGPNDYLVVGVPMPIECEALPLNGEPLLGISISIKPAMLQLLVKRLMLSGYNTNEHSNELEPIGMHSVQMQHNMKLSCERLMETLLDDMECQVLGDNALMEVIYRALISPEGRCLFQLTQHEGQYAQLAKVLDKIHRNYAQNITVAEMAMQAHMSISAFHIAFRTMTQESPLQYLKKIRLNRAKELILSDGKRVSEAAGLVGYQSASQFSREFKRHFSQSPKEMRLVS